MENASVSLQVWPIAKSNLRHNFAPHFLLAVVLLALTPVLFGVVHLDGTASAVPLEAFVSLTGIVLLTPVFQPEQNPEIEETVQARYVSGVSVYWIRIAYSLLALLLLIGGFAAFMRLGGCAVDARLVFGAVSDAVFLGGLGMAASAAAGNTAVSYMAPMVYYALNFVGGDRFGVFNLFSMMSGGASTKGWLFGAGAALVAVSVLIKWLVRKYK